MKKRILALFLIAMLLLAGCGKSGSGTWKPEKVSKDIRPYVERAIEIIDDYLAFDISAEEADEAFHELKDRLDGSGVIESDSKYSYTDKGAAYLIYQLAIGKSENRVDTEFYRLRDMLAFHIGDEVSGKAYPVENQSNLFGDEAVPQYLQQFSAPAASANFSVINSKSYISLSFDAINGVQPASLITYINSLIDSIPDDNKTPVVIDLTYEYYEQLVFGLRLTIDGASVTGSYENLSNESTLNIVDVKSAAEIESALASGAKHLGNYKVPELEEIAVGSSASAATVEYKEYPQEIFTSQDQFELALLPLVPDIVYVTTGEENGLIGTMYRLYGTVEDHVKNEDGFVEYFRIDTNEGSAIVMNPAAQFLYGEDAAALGDVDKDALDKYYPIPAIDESVIIYTSYEGFSNKYNCPSFLYGGQDYMLDVVLQFLS